MRPCFAQVFLLLALAAAGGAQDPAVISIHGRTREATALRGVGPTFSHGRERHRARNTLVVVQMALALVLLGPHAFSPASLANQPERVMRMWNEILDKLAALPGVTSVALADCSLSAPTVRAQRACWPKRGEPSGRSTESSRCSSTVRSRNSTISPWRGLPLRS